MSQPIRGRVGRLFFFSIDPKNTNFVEDADTFLRIPFFSFRGEEENMSANQRSGRPSFFLIGPKKQTW